MKTDLAEQLEAMQIILAARATGKDLADHTRERMGLTTWAKAPGGRILKSDVVVAKNHLTEAELADFGRIVNAYLHHSFWFLPNVAACHAMANLLAEKHNTFWHDYGVIVAAGASAGIGLDALPPVRKAVGSGLSPNEPNPENAVKDLVSFLPVLARE